MMWREQGGERDREGEEEESRGLKIKPGWSQLAWTAHIIQVVSWGCPWSKGGNKQGLVRKVQAASWTNNRYNRYRAAILATRWTKMASTTLRATPQIRLPLDLVHETFVYFYFLHRACSSWWLVARNTRLSEKKRVWTENLWAVLLV